MNIRNDCTGKRDPSKEIDVNSRLSGNSASSEDQNGSKTVTSSNNEGETITETPPNRLSGVPRLKRENAFILTDFPAKAVHQSWLARKSSLGLKNLTLDLWNARYRFPLRYPLGVFLIFFGAFFGPCVPIALKKNATLCTPAKNDIEIRPGLLIQPIDW